MHDHRSIGSCLPPACLPRHPWQVGSLQVHQCLCCQAIQRTHKHMQVHNVFVKLACFGVVLHGYHHCIEKQKKHVCHLVWVKGAASKLAFAASPHAKTALVMTANFLGIRTIMSLLPRIWKMLLQSHKRIAQLSSLTLRHLLCIDPSPLRTHIHMMQLLQQLVMGSPSPYRILLRISVSCVGILFGVGKAKQRSGPPLKTWTATTLLIWCARAHGQMSVLNDINF